MADAEPNTYIAFLGAINVGGRFVKMERLRQLFEELGFTHVRSYIQSGNLFFQSPGTDREALTRAIESHLAASLGYEVPVLLRTLPEVEHALALDPFQGVEITPEIRLCILFVSDPWPDTVALPLRSPKGDCEVVGATAGELFLVLRLVNGRPPDPSSFLAKTFKPRAATTRFFHTTAKILEAARKS